MIAGIECLLGGDIVQHEQRHRGGPLERERPRRAVPVLFLGLEQLDPRCDVNLVDGRGAVLAEAGPTAIRAGVLPELGGSNNGATEAPGQARLARSDGPVQHDVDAPGEQLVQLDDQGLQLGDGRAVAFVDVEILQMLAGILLRNAPFPARNQARSLLEVQFRSALWPGLWMNTGDQGLGGLDALDGCLDACG